VRCIFLIKHPTSENLADITTKPLTGALFEKFRSILLGINAAATDQPSNP